jgi:CubicO group peptidase (beta-lactamase class C family)
MRSLRLLLVAVLICVGLPFSVPARSDTGSQCGHPIATGDGWQTASPDEKGVDAVRLCSLNEMLGKSSGPNVHAVVVVRGGKLIYEIYRTGIDEKWGSSLGAVAYAAEMPHDVRSISKSVVSLLFGIALDRHLVASIDDPVFEYFPDYAALRTPEKDRIQLRHLLAMTSGLEWDEDRSYSDPKNSEIMMIRSPDPYRFVLEQAVKAEPGKLWNYSGGSTQLLAAVLQRRTGRPLAEFAEEALFEPLGITQFEWVKMPANGEAAAASGLRLRPRDMAKIGELVLENGVWNGHRIVSEAWIEESTKPLTEAWLAHRYGYQWWIGESKIGGGINMPMVSWVAGWGLGGQRIFVVREYDLVVVITAGLYDSESQGAAVLNILANYVLPAIRQ